MNKIFTGITIAILFAMVLILSAKSCSNEKIIKSYEKELSIPDDLTNSDTTKLTVSDVLNMREELRLAKYNDSVYLAIPNQILTAILVTEGTNKSIKEIVHTYIVNKDFYDNVVKKSMDIQKNLNPDSIPKKSLPEPCKDSVQKALNNFTKTNNKCKN